MGNFQVAVLFESVTPAQAATIKAAVANQLQNINGASIIAATYTENV